MKFKFKIQPYQTNAVQSVIDCFNGQPFQQGSNYRIDPGLGEKQQKSLEVEGVEKINGYSNAHLVLKPEEVLANIKKTQQQQNLMVSKKLEEKANININLDIEMETGTGKTYCYTKTIFEMNKLYGWTKFIIIVPSIAIREGIYNSLKITAEHFAETYDTKAKFFIYNSRKLEQLEDFSSDSKINIMIINIQAFNARGKDNRRIYDALDDFQSRRPIDVISSNNPILILDEPQKMGGPSTEKALPEFNPLMVLRYSATHKTTHNLIHRLDAIDAYNQKLVKKINVRGISVKGLAGSDNYIYFEAVEISPDGQLTARMEIDQKLQSGDIKRKRIKFKKGDSLYDISGGLEQYKDLVISEIDAYADTVEFTTRQALSAGEVTQDITEDAQRRIQIRETIKAHIEKEKLLYEQGIKVLSLFFIDKVAKYRDYGQPDTKGEYARIFEEEYEALKNEYLAELPLEQENYRAYLKGIDAAKTHNGYFSIDKKTNHMADPKNINKESDDTDAYDLILKDKAKLLSMKQPTRFIFSHSALREGWDNPNVFVMCMLKHSDNTISRRQEVGRGLRLCVDQNGDRVDDPDTTHDTNILTVVASESYEKFVSELQKEIVDDLGSRPRKADVEYFKDKIIQTDDGEIKIDEKMATNIHHYLIRNGYVDTNNQITNDYHEAKEEQKLAPLPDELLPHEQEVFKLIDSVSSKIPGIGDDRKTKANPLNDNFNKAEFKELWNRINKKAIYKVRFDSKELIENCIDALNKGLRVQTMKYTIESGSQKDEIKDSELGKGKSFEAESTEIKQHEGDINSTVKYDLIGKVAENTELTRNTIGQILTQIDDSIFNQFKQNPEHFISQVSRLIKEQKADKVIKDLTYSKIDDTYDSEIFTASQIKKEFKNATKKLGKHIYDYVVGDSKIEKDFAEQMDGADNITVYAKLPRGFLIPTPVGNYNPDWAIAFKKENINHIYFVAETKGSLSSLELRGVEEKKIKCARKFFDEINETIGDDKIKYDVITNFDDLMRIVNPE